MAIPELHELEQRLETVYLREIQLYTALLNKMDELPVETIAGEHAEIALQQMALTMNEVAELDRVMLPLRERWKQLGGNAEGSLGGALRDTERLIVALMERIQQVENAAVEMKNRLTPQISTETRRRQMANAYRAAKQHG
jgi:division protein CdvB (Snf7/Vps24/ESCRT-III family)